MPKIFDKWVERIKSSLRKKYPKEDEKKIESRAYAIATKMYQRKYHKNP